MELFPFLRPRCRLHVFEAVIALIWVGILTTLGDCTETNQDGGMLQEGKEASVHVPSENSHFPTSDIILRILQSEAPYKDEAQQEACKRLVDELTADEQELAARTSYAYWVASITGLLSEGRALDSEAVKRSHAMREARRHYVAEQENHAKTVSRLREVLQDRKERHVDVFRTCLQEHADYDLEDEARTASRYRDYLRDDMQKQPMVVRGRDRDSRAIVVKFPRFSGDTNVEAYVAAQLYIAERGIAATEVSTEGNLEKVLAIFDFGEYNSKNSPPLSAVKTVAHVLQRNYPERLELMIILNAPYWMRMVFKILHPFLSADTRRKIQVVSTSEQQKVLESLVAEGFSAGQLTSQFDLDLFFKLPFHELYDHTKDVPTSGFDYGEL